MIYVLLARLEKTRLRRIDTTLLRTKRSPVASVVKRLRSRTSSTRIAPPKRLSALESAPRSAKSSKSKDAADPRTAFGRNRCLGLRAAAQQHAGSRQDGGVDEEGRCRDPGVARSVSASVDTLRILRRGRRERITVLSTQSRRRTPGSAFSPTKWASASSSARAPSASR